MFSLKTTTKTWSDARIDCKGMNHTYDLAVIDDAGVDNFVSNFASQHYDDPYEVWIGLSDTKTEGYFQWVGGSKPKYTNWNNGEPNGKSVIEVYTCLIGITAVVSIFIYDSLKCLGGFMRCIFFIT